MLLTRRSLGDNFGDNEAAAQSTVAMVGLLRNSDELLLLGPDGTAAGANQSLLQQLGLQSWRDAGLPPAAAAVADKNVGGLGGGFKRFVWQPFAGTARPRHG